MLTTKNNNTVTNYDMKGINKFNYTDHRLINKILDQMDTKRKNREKNMYHPFTI